MDRLRVSIEGGKYTVVMDAGGRLFALRNGKPWRELSGDKLVYALAAEIERCRELLEWSGTPPGYTGAEWQEVIHGKLEEG